MNALPILGKRNFMSDPQEKVAGVVERWIDHLEEHSGIWLSKALASTGSSICRLWNTWRRRVYKRELGKMGRVAAIAENFWNSVWSEVCLLVVGSHAEDGDFLDAVYESVAASVYPDRWDFLIRCLRSGALLRRTARGPSRPICPTNS